MKNGYRIIDTDTHVGPSVETLEEYAGPRLRQRWDELAPYYMQVTEGGHHLSINPMPFKRAMRQTSAPVTTAGAGAKSSLSGSTTNLWQVAPEPQVQNRNVAGRLRDMDREGRDVDLIIPATFSTAASALDTELACELYSAYHRYIADYCSVAPDRLKAALLLTGADPQWSAAELRRYASEEWVTAATPVLPEGLPLDDRSLDPIWQAMDEANLGILHHSFFYEPPYFPGYRDIWGNVVVARAAAHPWGAQRLLGYLLLSGLLDEYATLRIGFAECSAGWLPGWITRLQGQAHYLRTALPERKRTPMEYIQDGRVFCGIEPYEGEAMAKGIIEVVGDGCLLYQSDYPHGQCLYPTTPDVILSWEAGLGKATMRRIMSENAERYLRMSVTGEQARQPLDGAAAGFPESAHP
jgi:predicted TIM-barrel fold metal-dependent hydrolase